MSETINAAEKGLNTGLKGTLWQLAAVSQTRCKQAETVYISG